MNSYPQKAKAFLALLRNYHTLRIFFMTTVPGTCLPEFLKTQPVQAFDYGLALPVPIPDLDVNEFGIAATLSFGRVPYPTFVPWDAIAYVRDPNAPEPPTIFEVGSDVEFKSEYQDASKVPAANDSPPVFRLVKGGKE